MKKGLKTGLRIGALLLLILAAGAIALQSPAVQGGIARRVVDRLTRDLGVPVSFSDISIKPFEAVVIKDVLVLDPSPVIKDMDTLLWAGTLSARFSLKGLTSSEGIHLGSLALDQGCFYLAIEPDSLAPKGVSTNLQRIFGLPYPDPDKKKELKLRLEAGSVDVRDFHFRLENPVAAAKMEAKYARKGRRPVGEHCLDYNSLDLGVKRLKAHGISVKDAIIRATADSIRLRDNDKGLAVEQLSGKVKVGKGRAQIQDIEIKETDSHILVDHVILDGKLKQYADFEENIGLDVQVKKGSRVSMRTISHFGPGLDKIRFRGQLQGRFKGLVNDFSLENIKVKDLDSGVELETSGSLTGLPDIGSSLADFQVKRLQFTVPGLGRFIREWAPAVKLDLSKLAPGVPYRFIGRVKGPMNRLGVKGTIYDTKNSGNAKADVTLRNMLDPKRAIIAGGTLETSNLDIKPFTGADAVRQISLSTKLEATLIPGNPKLRIDRLDISRLNALDYDYSGLSAVGTYEDSAFDGRIVAADPNLQFIFQGLFNLSQRTKNAAYRFYASLGYADLHAIHLDKRPRSKVSLQAVSNFIRTQDRELIGDVNLRDIAFESEGGQHNLGDLSIQAHSNENLHRIRLSSEFMDAHFVGDRSIAAFVKDLKGLLESELPALGNGEKREWNGASYDLGVNVKDARDLLNFLAPGVYVENNSSMDLQLSRSGVLEASLNSGRLALNDNYLRDVDLELDNLSGRILASLGSSVVRLGGAELRGNKLVLLADDDHIGLGYNFDNESDTPTKAELYLNANLRRDKDGLFISGRALPSNIYYGGDAWALSSDTVSYKNGNVKINGLRATHEDESLVVNGGFSPDRADTLSIQLQSFNLGLANTVTGGKPSLQGRATGRALILSPSKPSPGLLATIRCDSTMVAGERLGTLNLSSLWNEAERRFDFAAVNDLDGKCNLDLGGSIKPSSHELNARARLDSLNLAYAAPYLESVFSTFKGYLSGILEASGPVSDPALKSDRLRLDGGRIALDFTGVSYNVNGDLSLDSKGLHFDSVSVNDGVRGKGSIGGSVLLDGLKRYGLDMQIGVRDMKAISLSRGQNPLLWGDLAANGSVNISGWSPDLVLDLDAATAGQGNIHINLGNSSSSKNRHLLSFTQPIQHEMEDPYEQMLLSKPGKGDKADGNLTVHLIVRATPDLTAYIDISNDNSLNATGTGRLEIDLERGNLNLNGIYNLNQGHFHFSAANLVSRDFSVQDGSSLRFNGEAMDTDLDIRGLYTTKASLANLISDETATSRRTVDCGIHITDKLRNPQVQFSIDIPDLNPTTQAMVDGVLNTEDKIQRQFLYLLLAGSFLPEENYGITTDGSEMLLSNVSSIMAGQLNNIFQALDLPLDLGLNYKAQQSGSDLFDVALSTQLFNNRVIVNSSVGNKQQYGTTTSEVAGDVDIDIKLNKRGSLRLNLFSHSADQYTSYLDNSQRNGAGISYQKEFSSFGQFFRNLFRKRSDRLPEDDGRRRTLQLDSTGRAHILTDE